LENIEKFFEKEYVVGNIADQISQRNLSDHEARVEKWLVTGPDKEGGIRVFDMALGGSTPEDWIEEAIKLAKTKKERK